MFNDLKIKMSHLSSASPLATHQIQRSLTQFSVVNFFRTNFTLDAY